MLAGALGVWAAVPGALADGPGPLASQRSALLAVAVALLVLGVVLGPRLRAPALRPLRWLVDPRPWLVFGLLFHVTSLVFFGLGAFVGATLCGYVLCGIGPVCVAWVQRLTRALARVGVPMPAHLRRDQPVPPEDPSLPHLHHDPATLPAWAWWAAGALVLAGGVLALRSTTDALAWWHGSWLVAAAGLVAVGWRAARRVATASPGTATPSALVAWAHGPAGRLAAGGLFAHHVLALVVWQVPKWPSLPWRDTGRELVSPWMDLTFTKQLWSMFAPNGPVRNWTLRTTVVDEAGATHDLRTELQHPENLRRPYLFYDAWRKVDEGLSGNRSKLAPWHARYLCRRWALEHGGALPREVVLERVSAPFPPMQPLDPQAWFWEHAEVTPIVRIACRDDAFGRLDADVRRRRLRSLGLRRDARDDAGLVLSDDSGREAPRYEMGGGLQGRGERQLKANTSTLRRTRRSEPGRASPTRTPPAQRPEGFSPFQDPETKRIPRRRNSGAITRSGRRRASPVEWRRGHRPPRPGGRAPGRGVHPAPSHPGRAEAGAHARGATPRDQGPAGAGRRAEREAELHPPRGARPHRCPPRRTAGTLSSDRGLPRRFSRGPTSHSADSANPPPDVRRRVRAGHYRTLNIGVPQPEHMSQFVHQRGIQVGIELIVQLQVTFVDG